MLAGWGADEAGLAEVDGHVVYAEALEDIHVDGICVSVGLWGCVSVLLCLWLCCCVAV